jgi:hypothetical protein
MSVGRSVGKIRFARAQSCLVALLWYVVFDLDVTAVNVRYQTCERIGTASDGITNFPSSPKISLIRLALYKSSGYYKYHRVLTFKNSTFCPECICVSCGSRNKQQLFPYAALPDLFFIIVTQRVHSAVRAETFNSGWCVWMVNTAWPY